MKEKIKTIFPAFLVVLVLVFPLIIDARSGCCSWHGGVCGCQCCDGTPLSSTCLPYYPECGGGGFYNPPSYDYPSYTPSIPDCPLNSYYDSISGSCKCYSGYVVSGGKCISANQWCQDKYGLWATYDYLTDGCKCMSGYIFGKDFLGETTCVSTDQYCRDLLGYNARYNILTDSCECGYGYVLSGGSCVDGDSLCHQKYGYNSYHDSLTDSCKCNYGYVFNSLNQCVSENDYCQDLYGFNAEYNTLTDKCVCKRGYVIDSNKTKCIDGNTYCRDKYGIHSSYGYWSEECECDYGYKLRNGQCVTPTISNIYPLEVKVGEEVTIKGENFDDSKYGDLKLYVGSVKVDSSDISKWQNDKIIFEVGDYLESGYLVLKDSSVNLRSSYLEISEPEEEQTPIYSYTPIIEESTTEQEPTSANESKTETNPKSQVQSELESEPQPQSEEAQPSEIQEMPKEEQMVKNKQEQNKSILTSVSVFAASIFRAVKNFFYRIFY